MAFLVKTAEQLLASSSKQGRLAHAYLITGPEHSGKRQLTLRIMNLVSGHDCSSIEQAAGEYVQIVRPESKSRRIKVDAMRLMERRLYLAVPKGATKIAIILDADRLMPEAANAFLKTLEEPPKQSLLLLLSAHPEQLLDTVRSRCIHIPLHKPGVTERSASDQLVLKVLAEHFETSGQASIGGALAIMGAFAAVLRAEKAAILKRHSDLHKAESSAYAQTTDGEWLKRREDFYKALTESEYIQRRNALVQVLIDWFGDALRQHRGSNRVDLESHRQGTRATAEIFDDRELLHRIDALEQLRADLNTNVQETLALEASFLAAYA